MLAGLSLDRALWQGPGRREHLVEQLVVEIVAVGQHDRGRVCHGRVPQQLADVEQHLQALAGPLRVPHDASPPVTALYRRDGLGDCLVHRMELVVLRDPFH